MLPIIPNATRLLPDKPSTAVDSLAEIAVENRELNRKRAAPRIALKTAIAELNKKSEDDSDSEDKYPVKALRRSRKAAKKQDAEQVESQRKAEQAERKATKQKEARRTAKLGEKKAAKQSAAKAHGEAEKARSNRAAAKQASAKSRRGSKS